MGVRSSKLWNHRRHQIGSIPEIYDIDAKMDSTREDALQKLSHDNHNVSFVGKKSRMLQVLLADRLKLTIHHESRELPFFACPREEWPKTRTSKT